MICIHCGVTLTEPLGTSGLYLHANNLQRCQRAVPYGHMGHPAMPCPVGSYNDCIGASEENCDHITPKES